MDEKQFERLLDALFDIKAEIRDLRNDLRKAHTETQRASASRAARKVGRA